MSESAGNDPELLLLENEALRRRVATLEVEARRFKATLYSIGDAVITADADGNVLQMNPVAEALTGWSEVEAKGRPTAEVFRIVNEETRSEVESPVARVLREGVVVGLANHSLLIARDGTERPIADSGAPILDEKSEVSGVVLVFRDQTEERAAQRALAESERKFRDTVRYLDEGYYSCAPDGLLLDHNIAFNRMLGFDISQDLRGSRLPDFWQDPDDRKEYLSQLMATGVVKNYLINARTIKGDNLVMMANSHLVKDDQGRPVRIDGTFTDFTERKRMEEGLGTAGAYNRSLIEASLDPLVTIRPDGKITDVNRATESATGCSREELIGTDFSDYFVEPDQAQAGYQRVFREGSVQDYPLTIQHRDGHATEVLYNASVYRNEAGKVIGVFAAARDITERRRAERESRRLNEELEQRVRDRTAQLEQANKELEAFSYSVSHDLRAPLRAIDGFTRVLVDEYEPHLNTEGKRICSVIRENTRSMSRLIDDLLAFSRLGRAEMQPSPIDMGAMANAVFYELTTPESRERLDFCVGPLPAAVGDPSLMRQVWTNLLGNAIKFSSKRARAVIQVSGELREGESVYAVQDDGAGFDMQYVQKLFGVFQRLHSTREFEGNGVGLALVQRVIRRHGGRVWAEGETDRGATFYFALAKKGA